MTGGSTLWNQDKRKLYLTPLFSVLCLNNSPHILPLRAGSAVRGHPKIKRPASRRQWPTVCKPASRQHTLGHFPSAWLRCPAPYQPRAWPVRQADWPSQLCHAEPQKQPATKYRRVTRATPWVLYLFPWQFIIILPQLFLITTTRTTLSNFIINNLF